MESGMAPELIIIAMATGKDMLLKLQLLWIIMCVVHRYDGEWRNDERHGRGVMIYHCDDDNTFEKYEGEWVSRSYHRSVAYVSLYARVSV